jgi:hypothetical protein
VALAANGEKTELEVARRMIEDAAQSGVEGGIGQHRPITRHPNEGPEDVSKRASADSSRSNGRTSATSTFRPMTNEPDLPASWAGGEECCEASGAVEARGMGWDALHAVYCEMLLSRSATLGARVLKVAEIGGDLI